MEAWLIAHPSLDVEGTEAPELRFNDSRERRPADGRVSGFIMRGSFVMLYWALIFLLVAVVAAVFGFGGIASASAGIAQILFFIFLVLFIAGLVMHFTRGRAP